MKRWTLILTLVAAAAGVVWLAKRRAAPVEIPVAKAKVETLESIVTTNGRTEPLDWSPARAETAGRIVRILVERGQRVQAGSPLAALDDVASRAERSAAAAKLDQAAAELRALESGGNAAELARIDGTIQKLEAERRVAERDLAVLGRLLEKNAATRREAEEARDRAAAIEVQIAAERSRRAVLVTPADLEAARARVRDAAASLKLAERKIALCTVQAPRAGVVYDMPVKAGDWVDLGALVARVGELAKLRAVIYVDEPELGRVRAGLPVTITWDALPSRQWQARIEQAPTQVAPMGTRMVGEVIAVCENPGQILPPGANINVRIRAQVVQNALTIPKAALRRQGQELGVFVVENGRLAWRKVEVGVTSDVTAEVRSGLRVSDAVALPVDRPLQSGMEVAPALAR